MRKVKSEKAKGGEEGGGRERERDRERRGKEREGGDGMFCFSVDHASAAMKNIASKLRRSKIQRI